VIFRFFFTHIKKTAKAGGEGVQESASAAVGGAGTASAAVGGAGISIGSSSSCCTSSTTLGSTSEWPWRAEWNEGNAEQHAYNASSGNTTLAEVEQEAQV
jgi:hypothetical protein